MKGYKLNGVASIAMAMGLTLALGSCSDNDESTPTAAEPEQQISDQQAAENERIANRAAGGEGATLYEEVCAACHDGGTPKAPHRSMLEITSPESIYKALTQGVMQAESADLNDSQKRAVAEYITGLKIGAATAKYPVVMCEGEAADFDYGRPPALKSWGFTPGNTRAIPADIAGLNQAGVQAFELKWAFAYPDAMRARSQPLAAGGAIYVGGHQGDVYALEAGTGCARWIFHASAEVRTAVVVSDWVAGDNSATPMAYFGDLLGNVYAIDAVTGEQVWRDRPDDHPSATITGTPTLHDGKLFVPVSSLEVTPAADPAYPCCTFRGSVIAYNAIDGAKIWQTYTIDQEPASIGQNRSGTDNFGPSGAPTWNSPAIDIKRNQLYFGTGENYSSPATLTSDAIFALDLDTGAVNWTYQGTSQDAWNTSCDLEANDNCPVENGPDFDFGASVTLASHSDGTDYVLGGQKSGMVHALNPDTGELVWQTKVGRGGIQGGIHFGMAAENDAVFVPVTDMPDGRDYPEPDRPGLYALDLKTGDYLWQQPLEDFCDGAKFCAPGISAAVVVSSGMVFAGAMDGRLRVHDAATGEIIWTYNSLATFQTVSGAPAKGGSFGGAAGPLLIDGMMFINSGYGIYFHMPGNVLLAFGPR